MENIKRIPQLTHSTALKKNAAFWLVFWRVVSFTAVIHLAIFDLLILTASEAFQVQFAPDDGYYYLSLARNFVRFGQRPFDGGTSVTSGFHLLQAHVLAGFYKFLQPTSASFVHLGLAFDASVTILVVAMAWWVCLRKNDAFFLVAFTILIGAKPFLFHSISITEWSLVILLAGLYCFSFYRHEKDRGVYPVLFMLGLFGSLARSDVGLLPLGIFVSAYFLEIGSQEKLLRREALAGLLGVSLGLGIVLVHNFMITGAMIQSSALMKSYWAPFVHQKFYNAVAWLLKVIGLDLGFADFDRSLFLLGVLLISGPLLLIVLGRISGQNNVTFSKVNPSADQPRRERVLVLAAVFCLIGYSIFYAHNGAIQHWYTANLLGPAFILLFAGAHYLDPGLLHAQQLTLIWLSVFALTALGVQMWSLYPLRPRPGRTSNPGWRLANIWHKIRRMPGSARGTAVCRDIIETGPISSTVMAWSTMMFIRMRSTTTCLLICVPRILTTFLISRICSTRRFRSAAGTTTLLSWLAWSRSSSLTWDNSRSSSFSDFIGLNGDFRMTVTSEFYRESEFRTDEIIL